jgi:superfamily II DNA or RNA helicase
MKKTKDLVRLEALGVLRKHKRAGAGISMGVGKTRLGLEHFQLVVNKLKEIKLIPAKGLIVAPTKKIIQGWKDEAKKWDMEELLDNLIFSTYRSLSKNTLDYDVVYLDECHSLKMSHNEWLSLHEGYVVGLTGTPPKYKGSEKQKMINRYCPIVYEYLIGDAVDDKILNDYKITVHMLSLGSSKNYKVEIKDRRTKQVTKQWWTSEQENYDYWTGRLNAAYDSKSRQMMSIMRMKAMQAYVTKDDYGKKLLDQSKEKCILFANTQDQADKLCKHSYHANNKDSDDNMVLFEEGQIKKLSCVLQLSEGANISGLKESIILHAYGNNRKASQRIGRTLRLNPNDTSHIHVLCFKNTKDFEWVKSALADYDQNKIEWYDPDIF